MKPSQVIEVLKVAYVNNRRVLLTGSPGISKSEIMKQAAKEVGYEIVMLHPVVSDPVDYKGFPFVNANGEADFIPFATLKRMIDADKPIIFAFDDLGQAQQSVQSALMQILLERGVNGKKISDHVRFVAATNRRKDNAGVGNLITPLLNRFSSIIELEPNVEDWCAWALKNNVPIEVIQFIRFRRELLSNFKAEKDIKNFSSPRSLYEMGLWIQQGISDIEVLTGCVGEACAVEFLAFYKIFQSISNLPDQVFNNPLSAKILDKPDQMFALLGVLSKRVNDVNITNLFKYLDRIPKEFQMVVVSNIISGKPELQNTKAYIDWQIKNADMI